MTEYTKINFFKKLVMSVKDIDKYDQLAVQPIRKTISYFLKLILLFSTVMAIIYGMEMYQLVNKAKAEIDTVSNFEYKNGELTFKSKKPILIDNVSNILNSVLILPDESEETAKEATAKVKTYDSYLILNKSNFVISVNESRLQYDYDEILKNYSIKKFDKAEIKTFIEELDGKTLAIAFFCAMVIYLFFWYVISIGVDISITFIIGFIATRLARIRLKTSALVNVSIHSLTLSIILYLLYSIVNIFTGFEIANFRIMYIAVASVYAAISVLIIKADFIEKQQELAKVIKEQQAIRAEFENEENSENSDEEKKIEDNVEDKKQDNEENNSIDNSEENK